MRENGVSYRITDMPVSERPRERLAKEGPRELSDEELLAILLRVGGPGENAVQMGRRLLDTYDGLQGLLKIPFEEIRNQYGVGDAKAAQIVAAVELGRRLAKLESRTRTTIRGPKDAADLVMYEMNELEQEEIRVIALDTRNQVVKIETIYKGSLNSSQVRVGELFRSAVRFNAAAVIVVHNHPSGDPSPSLEDIEITRLIVQAGQMLDIKVLDHLIIGLGRFVSLKERGVDFGTA